MEIRDYPELIAEKELSILRRERHLAIDRNTIDHAIAEADRQIAFDETLRNDHQRKARRQEILHRLEWFEEVDDRIHATEEEVRKLSIELNLLRNQFSVERLLLRERVALAEVAA